MSKNGTEHPSEYPKPDAAVLPEDDPKTVLVARVRDALSALPFYFESKTVIEGIEAGDLFGLNSVLGGTIEIQAVAALNRMRTVWDPDDDWSTCGFERSSQTFPDVRLVNRDNDTARVELGIELKGWYLLSREKEPSFRYKATPDASSPFDLIAVYPWHLTNLLSGTPVALAPYIEQARYAALMRNYYWEHERGVVGATVTHPTGVISPYMPPKTKLSDSVTSDTGSNFGRLARTHDLMKDYCAETLAHLVVGVPAKDWIDFMKMHTDSSDPNAVSEMLLKKVASALKPGSNDRAQEIVDGVIDLLKLSKIPE